MSNKPPSATGRSAHVQGQSMSRRDLSIGEARRLAISTQGLNRTTSSAPVKASQSSATTAPEIGALRPSVRQIRASIRQLGLLQIDSVNVLVRAHYLPLLARLGSYDQTLIDAEAYRGRKRTLFEYWGHEASLIPVETQPLLRWRMHDAANGIGIWRDVAKFGRENGPLIDAVLREIEQGGPLSASGLSQHANSEEGRAGKGSWWGWGNGKLALEWLFWSGAITTLRRETAGFARVYDLSERALPTAVLETPTPTREEAQRQLLCHAIRAHGVATAADLRDYFRLPVSDCNARLVELIEDGKLLPVKVEGWKQQAYLDPAARLPRQVSACALLAPFDPLIWERNRTERLFGFRYRLEIYTPPEKRVHGYYVLPFLLGDRLVARLCLKADRPDRALQVNTIHLEAQSEAEVIVPPLAQELAKMARWLDLEKVKITARGGIARALRAELQSLID